MTKISVLLFLVFDLIGFFDLFIDHIGQILKRILMKKRLLRPRSDYKQKITRLTEPVTLVAGTNTEKKPSAANVWKRSSTHDSCAITVWAIAYVRSWPILKQEQLEFSNRKIRLAQLWNCLVRWLESHAVVKPMILKQFFRKHQNATWKYK